MNVWVLASAFAYIASCDLYMCHSYMRVIHECADIHHECEYYCVCLWGIAPGSRFLEPREVAACLHSLVN